jgi:hypothetical protein
MIVSKDVLKAQILGQNEGSSRRHGSNLMESGRALQGGQRRHRLKGDRSSPKRDKLQDSFADLNGTQVPFTKNQ